MDARSDVPEPLEREFMGASWPRRGRHSRTEARLGNSRFRHKETQLPPWVPTIGPTSGHTGPVHPTADPLLPPNFVAISQIVPADAEFEPTRRTDFVSLLSSAKRARWFEQVREPAHGTLVAHHIVIKPGCRPRLGGPVPAPVVGLKNVLVVPFGLQARTYWFRS